jgi:dephospho-CoA kinase
VHRALAELVTPSRVCLVYLSLPNSLRVARLSSREDSADQTAAGHRVETEVETALPSLADAVLDASKPLTSVVDACLDVLEQRLEQPEVIVRARRRIYALASLDAARPDDELRIL